MMSQVKAQARGKSGRFAGGAPSSKWTPARQSHSVRVVRSSFDANATTYENQNHWSKADGLSADAAASPDVRARIRRRAHYEIANNCYARGLSLTLANDLIGTGPHLQVLVPDAGDANTRTEHSFALWADEINLAEKLRCMRQSRFGDGEAFGLLTHNAALAHPVKLDLRLVEADQVTDPFGLPLDPKRIDGIELDDQGNPAFYRVMRVHPGSAFNWSMEFDRIQAADMIHWFRMDRPGQHRGVPEIMPSLPLFAMLRRWSLAVIRAAEQVADIAGVIESDMMAGDGEPVDLKDQVTVELERGQLASLPFGWKMAQMKAEQPGTTYAEGKREFLNEIARAQNVPYNVAAGNSSDYNYASGRLDFQVYFRSIAVDRESLSLRCCDRILRPWSLEYAYLTGDLLDAVLAGPLPHQWFFDGTEHVDPLKEAAAEDIRLRNGSINMAAVQARAGKDWEEEEAQRARCVERRRKNELKQIADDTALCRKLGIPEAYAAPAVAPAIIINDKGGGE